MAGAESWAWLGSALASFIFLWSVVERQLPASLTHRLAAWAERLFSHLSPYLEITISEHGAERFNRSDIFLAAEAYLSAACARRARKLKAELRKGSKSLQVSVGRVTDDFGGATSPRRSQGRGVTARNRQRRLFTNGPGRGGSKGGGWSHVAFEHPATFDTLAMDPGRKQEIVDDLEMFRDGKEYYAKVGKAWKRGYLLFGPPGTGKSTMIAAMANYLGYDVYDLELTAVTSNTELRKLFIETTGKSIIVIEDIDCSADLSGKRDKAKKRPEKKPGDDDDRPKLPMEPENDDGSKVTLSGLLNFIDGLWSACGGERIIVFTTNHKEELDQALIRRGRMDKHIEMSYCCFEAFKVLAKNYLDITEHELFGEIRCLLEETEMSPADVAENLMPVSKKKMTDTSACLAGLVEALKKAKEEAAAKAKAKEEAEAAAEVGNGKEPDEIK
ncbi:unnamed protein product [Urochloa decumbens]|uniref:AAA+ ATPase domain-containing protein n=1 Tax=Urochloa decumbens TaxID=240449 RepID=A0ABC9B7A5_9POAL